MTVKNRVKDMLPVLIVFFVVAAFGTMVFIEYVARDPIAIPAREQAPEAFVPQR